TARELVLEPCAADVAPTGMLRASRSGDLEHARVDVDELYPDVRQRIQNCRAEGACAGAEIDDQPARRHVAVEPVHNCRDHPVVVRDERPNRAVVVVGGDSEMSRDAMLHRHSAEHTGRRFLRLDARARYLTSVSILNIGMYIEMMMMPTMMPTPIIMIGSTIEVSDDTAASTSSS